MTSHSYSVMFCPDKRQRDWYRMNDINGTGGLAVHEMLARRLISERKAAWSRVERDETKVVSVYKRGHSANVRGVEGGQYYITRTERRILSGCADEITAMFPEWISLVELGSGSSTKTRVLIDAFLRRHDALRYAPVDISSTILEESS